MKTGKKITIYEGLNDPYLDSLRIGFSDTPLERLVKFFEERRKLDQFLGIEKIAPVKKTIEIKEITWI